MSENTQPKIMAIITKIINQNIVPLGGIAMSPNIEMQDPHKLSTNTVYVSILPIVPCGGHKQEYLNFSCTLGLCDNSCSYISKK